MNGLETDVDCGEPNCDACHVAATDASVGQFVTGHPPKKTLFNKRCRFSKTSKVASPLDEVISFFYSNSFFHFFR